MTDSSPPAEPSQPLPGRIPFGRPARDFWSLEPGLVFLNHGSFGAVPNWLRDRASAVRRSLESNPVAEVWRWGIPETRRAASQVAEFVGAAPDLTGLVLNATTGMNALIQSLPLEAGDEVLHVDQGYNAVWQTLLLAARRRGIVPKKVRLPLPVSSAEDALEAFESASGPRTRLWVLDQVTSPTALVLPVERLVALARSRGIEVIVDGAHAPGMLDRPAADARGAAGWTGNLHKWPCALRGAAVTTVREDLAATIKPPVVSHHLDQSFAAEFDWQGTHDPTPWILAPEAIRFMDRFGGWTEVRERNREMTIEAHAMLCDRLGVDPICPLDGSMTGFMATVRLPDALQPEHGGPPLESSNAIPGPDGLPVIVMDEVHRRLLADHRIEIPVVTHEGRRFVRFSVHVYNHWDEYVALAEALRKIAGASR